MDVGDTAVICVDCGAGNPDTNAYCGECGERIVRRGDGVALHPGFKGPRRLLVASSVVFAVSVAIAAADFLLIQASNPVSAGLNVGGPIVNMLLDVANVSPSGSPSDAVSFLIVGTFLLASLLAITSAVSGVGGGIWLRPRLAETAERSRVVAKHARDSAAERYGDAKPVVRRVAREGRMTFNEEVAPRVSTGIRKGTALGREWIRSRWGKGRDGSGS